MAWRDVKKAARLIVHQTMTVRAIFLPAVAYVPEYDSNSELIEPAEITVRVHLRDKTLGDQAGTSLNSAERFEEVPRLIFWADNLTAAGVTLAHGNVISVAAGEAYYIDVVEPLDGETYTAHVSVLDAEDSAGLPVPA